MSEFERGGWAVMAVVVALMSVALFITGSDDWQDGVTMSGLMVYIVILGKKSGAKR